MEHNYLLTAYLIYLPLALLMTFLVARTLFKSGKVFMLDIFNGREVIAVATNQLFEIGFYLMNIGTALYILKIDNVDSSQMLVEKLSLKIGFYSIYLGVMLFLNLYLFFRGKKVSKQRRVQVDMAYED